MNPKDIVLSVLIKWIYLSVATLVLITAWQLSFLGATITFFKTPSVGDFFIHFVFAPYLKVSPFLMFLSVSFTVPLWQRQKKSLMISTAVSSLVFWLILTATAKASSKMADKIKSAEKKFSSSTIYPYPSFEKEKIHRLNDTLIFLISANSEKGYFLFNLEEGKKYFVPPAIFSNGKLTLAGEKLKTSFDFLKPPPILTKATRYFTAPLPRDSLSAMGVIGIFILSVSTVVCLTKCIHTFDPIRVGIAGTFMIFSVALLVFNASFYLTNLTLSLSEGTRFEKLGIIWGYLVSSTLLVASGMIASFVRRKIK